MLVAANSHANLCDCPMSDAAGKDPPAKQSAREEERRQRKIVSLLMQCATLEELKGALRLLGMIENSAEWNAAIAAWREMRLGF